MMDNDEYEDDEAHFDQVLDDCGICDEPLGITPEWEEPSYF